MSLLGMRLKEIREDLDMNKAQFAKHVGSSPSSITRWEGGDMNITVDAIHSIADKLKINAAWLVGWDDDKYDTGDFTFKKIPVIGRVNEDRPLMTFENFEGFEAIKSGADFCVRVKDDAMIRAGISSGSTAFVKKQGEVNNGDLAAVLNGSSIIIRRYFKYGKQAILREEGVKFKDSEVDDPVIVGRVVYILEAV